MGPIPQSWCRLRHALDALALFVACNAQETDFADDVPASGGSGASKGGSAGSAGASASGGRGGSPSAGGTSGTGGSDSGGGAGSRATGGDAGSGSGGEAGGDAGGRGGEGGSAGGGVAGEGGGAAGGQDGEGGRDGRGGEDGEGSGGEGGSGSPDFACETSVGTPAQPVVSDLESGQLSAIAPYLGTWEPFFSGGNAMLSVVSDGADASDHALRLSGSNSTFAGLAIGLNDDGEHVCQHNAAAFHGVRFSYKSTHPLSVQLTSRATVPPPAGTCSGTCNNYHQKTFPPAAHWTEVVLHYSDLEQTFGTARRRSRGTSCSRFSSC